MKPRFPLFAQIVGWFFLNLALIAAVAWLFVRSSFSFGFETALLAYGEARVQALVNLVLADLGERPRTEWDEVLRQHAAAYHLDLRFYSNREGERLAGVATALPEGVSRKLTERFQEPGDGRGKGPPRDGKGPPGERPGPPPRGQGDNESPPWARTSPRMSPKYLVRVEGSPRYWLIARTMLHSPEASQMPVSVIAASDSLGFHGLLVDFKPWLLAAGAAVFVSALFWLPFVRGITRRVGEMKSAAQEIAEGRFNARVPERRRDELGDLGTAVNRMAERLGGYATGQKRFLGDVAHELCAPIARIQMALGILEQRETASLRRGSPRRAHVDDLREEVQHMSQLVNELLSFSKAGLRPQGIKLAPVKLADITRRVISREGGDAPITVEIPEGLAVLAEAELLTRALANIVRNAVRYAGSAGPIHISTHRSGGRVTLIVRDSGPGLPKAELERIFEPFYRPDDSRCAETGGAGLGLAIVKTCVESCHGTVLARNRLHKGLAVEITLAAAS